MTDRVTVRATFLSFPTEPPVEEWSFMAEDPDGLSAVDELGFEADLRDAFIEAGGANTLSIDRRSSWGGWGASGLSTLDIAISVGLGVASNALWSLVVSLFKKHVGTDPEASRADAPVKEPLQLPPGGTGRSVAKSRVSRPRKRSTTRRKKSKRRGGR